MEEPGTETTTMQDLANDVIEGQVTGGLIRRAPRDVVLMPVMDVALAKARLQELADFCAHYLDESSDGGTDGGDYGVIPGAGKKKVLFKSGADKLCDVYGLADRYTIISKVEDFDLGLFDYTLECTLVRKTDEMFVGSGLGACSSYESKYRWRESQRTCPSCGTSAIIKGREEYGGGWLCWAKKQGCGAKFNDGDARIEDQKIGRVENPDIMDTKNTVLKMAKKRAKVDAVIGVTRSSGIFTQDVDDLAHADDDGKQATKTAAPKSAAKSVAKPQPTAVNTAAPVAAPANETHAEKIARLKAAAMKTPVADEKPVTTTGAHPADTDAMDTSSGVEDDAPAQQAPVTPTADGAVRITAINVRNGPMVMKDGKSQPAWGPLFIIAFSAKVKASDGTMVSDASTFKQEDAALAEQARDAGQALKPVIVPGSKKGSFKLERFE